MQAIGTDNIVRRLRENDRSALNEVFDQYYESLCRFAGSYVALPDAEEIVSDVFFNIWKSRSTINIQISLRAYLYASVRYACYRALSNKTLPTLQLDELEEVIDHKGVNDPESLLIVQETHALITKSIAGLPARCRQIFMMNRFDALSYREIADILSIAEKTVENQIVKAIHVIRASLTFVEKR